MYVCDDGREEYWEKNNLKGKVFSGTAITSLDYQRSPIIIILQRDIKSKLKQRNNISTKKWNTVGWRASYSEHFVSPKGRAATNPPNPPRCLCKAICAVNLWAFQLNQPRQVFLRTAVATRNLLGTQGHIPNQMAFFQYLPVKIARNWGRSYTPFSETPIRWCKGSAYTDVAGFYFH